MSGVKISVSNLLRTGRDERGFKNLVGSKMSCLDFQDYAECVKYGFHMFLGYDAFTLNALKVGGQGGVGRDYNYFGELFCGIMNAFDKGDISTATKLTEKSKELIQMINDINPNLPMFKYLMGVLRGVDLGGCRLPLPKLSEEHKQMIGEKLDKVRYLCCLEIRESAKF